MIEKKCKEFSFVVKEELEHYPEVTQVRMLIDKAVENFRLSKKVGAKEEAEDMKAKIKEMKFAKEHLIRVMNLDFTRPTEKMKIMAEEANIDLKDPKIIEEFKMIQQQNLNDINRMRDGKSPLTEEELKSERSKMINKRHEERLRDQIAKNKETSDK